jgi:hypothetical protein
MKSKWSRRVRAKILKKFSKKNLVTLSHFFKKITVERFLKLAIISQFIGFVSVEIGEY